MAKALILMNSDFLTTIDEIANQEHRTRGEVIKQLIVTVSRIPDYMPTNFDEKMN